MMARPIERIATIDTAIVASMMLFALPPPPRLRLTIERGAYTKAIVRTFFEANNGRRSCLDSRLMCRSAAVKLARKIAETGAEVEVVGQKYNAIRPAPWQVHKVKRLDEIRLARVSALVSAASMFADALVTMEHDDEDREPA